MGRIAMTTVAIMQPAYLHWMGYFDLIDQADLFVLLDTVWVSKQSWQTRNRVVNKAGKVQWLSVPTDATPGMLLQDVRIVDDGRWRRKQKGTLEAIGLILANPSVDDREWWSLTPFTGQLIDRLCDVLGITTPIVSASKLQLQFRLDPLERLADILWMTEATEFLTAAGSSSYLNEGDLPVPTRFHEYVVKGYPQQPVKETTTWRPFVPYMSVVDCLARHGPEATLETIRAGRREKAPLSEGLGRD